MRTGDDPAVAMACDTARGATRRSAEPESGRRADPAEGLDQLGTVRARADREFVDVLRRRAVGLDETDGGPHGAGVDGAGPCGDVDGAHPGVEVAEAVEAPGLALGRRAEPPPRGLDV